jgi:hypothetical protein
MRMHIHIPMHRCWALTTCSTTWTSTTWYWTRTLTVFSLRTPRSLGCASSRPRTSTWSRTPPWICSTSCSGACYACFVVWCCAVLCVVSVCVQCAFLLDVLYIKMYCISSPFSSMSLLTESTTMTSRYDHQERLTAQEAMAHPYFAPVRAAEQLALSNGSAGAV